MALYLDVGNELPQLILDLVVSPVEAKAPGH